MFSKTPPASVVAVHEDISAHRNQSTPNPSKLLQTDILISCVNDLPAPRTPIEAYVAEAMRTVQKFCQRPMNTVSAPGEHIYLCPHLFEHWYPQNLPSDSSVCPQVSRRRTEFTGKVRLKAYNAWVILLSA